MSTRRTQLGMTLAFTIGILAAGATSSSAAVTLLFDDFESYAPGTGIAGQGGWYALIPEQAPIMIATGNGLTSLVLDGGIRTGDGSYTDANMPRVFHSLSAPLTGTGISTLSADAYAISTNRPHNSGVGFASADGSFQFLWLSNWYVDPQGPKWMFQTVGPGSVVGTFSGGFDQPISVEVVVDELAGKIYGRLTHSGGSYETPHVAITPEQVASLTEVLIIQDYRDSLVLGAEFDNIRVTAAQAIPAVSEWGVVVMTLLFLTAGTLVYARRRPVCRGAA